MSEEPAEKARRKPNIVWILGDQHRGQAVGYMGDPNVCTPNLDRMAVEGIAFSGAVAGFPLCCPYRGALISGLYPHKCVPGHQYRLPPELPTVAHAFRDAGYKAAYFGKWHLDGFHERDGRAAMHIVPPERRGGFDPWVGYDNNNAQWDCWVHGGEGDGAFHRRLDGYETDCLTDLLIGYIRERSQGDDGPFFAVLSVQPPHDPYLAPEEWMRRHNPAGVELRPNVPPTGRIRERARKELAGYYAQIENLDWNVGRVLQSLSETGLQDDTFVIFFSDHGDMHGSHGQLRKTGPYEEAIRIPFIIHAGPNVYGKRHGLVNVPINHVDVAPTSLGLCGLGIPEWMEGVDYSGRFLPGRPAVEEPDSAYLQLVVPTGHGYSVDRPWRGVVTVDGWKYVCLEGQPWLMFDLNDDPFELANLAHNTQFRHERKRLHDRLRAWIADTGDQFRLPEL